MKKILLLLLTLSPLWLFAQKKYTFTYDYIQKKIITYTVDDKKEDIVVKDNDISKIIFNKGDIVKIIIPNINTYLYTISITIENQTFNNTPPPLISNIFPVLDPSTFASAFKIQDAVALVDSKVKPKATPSSDYSIKLADDIKKVNSAIKPFANNDLALSYKYFDGNTISRIANIRQMDIATLLTNYDNAIACVDTVQSDYLKYKSASDRTTEDDALLDALYNAFIANKYQDALKAYLSAQINVRPSDFSYETPDVLVTGENVHITVNISPALVSDDKKAASVNEAEVRQYDMKVKNLWHWSFSTGFFISNLASKTYITKPNTSTNNSLKNPVDTITGYRIVEDNDPKVAIGGTALIHYTYKITPGFELGAHFGVGIPINSKLTPNYLLGLSTLFFNDNRLGINFGFAAGYTQYLSPNVNTNVNFKNMTDVPISYVDKFKIDRVQLSITYNLSDLFKSSTKSTSDAKSTN